MTEETLQEALTRVETCNVPTLANRLQAVFADDWGNDCEADAMAVCFAFGAVFSVAPGGASFIATFPDDSQAEVTVGSFCPLR